MRQLTDDFEARYRSGDTPWEDPHPWQGLERLFARLVPPGAGVLDIGCGLGTNALRLSVLGYRVLGIDVSPTAIAQARARADAAGLGCEFRCADILGTDILHTDCGPFDAAFDRGCLHGFADAAGRAAFAAAVAAVLLPAGLWIDVSGSADNGDPVEEVRELALPRLTLADLAAAAEPHFEAVEVTQGAFGEKPDTGFRAWIGVFRRRGPSREVGAALPVEEAAVRGRQADRPDSSQCRGRTEPRCSPALSQTLAGRSAGVRTAGESPPRLLTRGAFAGLMSESEDPCRKPT